MKKVVRLNESDLELIVRKVITEQNDRANYVKGIQDFLNYKKITGNDKRPLTVDGRTDDDLSSQTAQAIAKYQSMIGVHPADGIFGPGTMEKMPVKDREILKKLIAKHGGLIDQFLNWIGL